jgi:hypothetical protein
MNKEIVSKALTEAKHTLAGDDAAVTDITRLITNHENGKRPYYIYDSVTGAKLGMSQLPVFEKRLTAFGGDILAMFASYKGRDSKPKTEPEAPKVVIAEPVEPIKTIPFTKVIQAAKREFKKVDKKPAEKGASKEYECATTKTDKHGNPTEQTITIREGGKVVKKEVRKIDPKDMVDMSELVGAVEEHNLEMFGEGR